MSGAGTGQVRALLRLRWTLVRSRARRTALLGLVAALPGVVLAVFTLGTRLPASEASAEVLVLLPTLFTAFAIFTALTPLLAGGGTSLFPQDELVVFNVSERSHGWMGLLLLPVNITWAVQVVGLAAATGYAIVDVAVAWSTFVGLVVWIGVCTAWGSALAWVVVGLRQRRDGRIATTVTGIALLLAVVLLVAGDRFVDLLDELPTQNLLAQFIRPPGTEWAQAVLVTAAVAAVGLVLLPRAASWALTRTSDRGLGAADRVHSRLRTVPTLWSLVRKDCLLAWRTPPLRRGMLTLGLLPLVLTAFSDVSWAALVLVPSLVAAGAVLLYGINAFCLDAGGAVWLGSLPVRHRTVLYAKALGLLLVTAVPVALAVLVGALAIRQLPTALELSAVATAGVLSVAVMVARGVRLSVTQPYRAQLLGPRDTPAPPGAMAKASAALAARGTGLALWMALSVLSDAWWGPLVLALPIACLVLASWLGTLRRWDDPVQRARVLVTVAYG